MRTLLSCLFVVSVCLFSTAAAQEPAGPNVVLILIDDMGLHDLSVEGSTFYESPNIDKLARGGMRFTQGYATCRVCSPSRASIQLGQFTARHGITDWIGAAEGMKWKRNDRVLPAKYMHNLPHDDVSLAEAMQEGGYKTFFAGKWHLGGDGSLPTDHGFQINKGGHHRGSPPGGYFSPYKNPVLENGPAGESLPLRLADETVSFIQSSKDKPFFAMLSFYSVHGPVQTTKELWSKYQKKAAETLPPRTERFKVDRTMPVRQVQDHPVYAGMVEITDTAVGRVMDALDDAGLTDNTIVIFTSDNGPVVNDGYHDQSVQRLGDHKPAGPWRGGKYSNFEGGTRVPLLIKWPGKIKAGTVSDALVGQIDFAASFAAIPGNESKITITEKAIPDSIDALAALTGKSDKGRTLLVEHARSLALREGPWKYVQPSKAPPFNKNTQTELGTNKRGQLYNLAIDGGEKKNLRDEHPEKFAELREKLSSIRAAGRTRPVLQNQ